MSATKNEDKKTGILLVNLGTPADPSPAGVRTFLREMLSDRRLIELPRAVWLPILHGIILRVRPRKSAHAYRQIWMPEGSPQLVFAKRLVAEVRSILESKSLVELGMSYGQPSIATALGALRDAGARRIVVLPLYPQYAGVTTASVFDRISAELRRWRVLPELRFINEYHAAPGYIAALRDSILDHWHAKGRAQHLLMSFHSMPQRNFERGDPYRGQCEETARLVARALDLKQDEWSVSFQSRFGLQEWLRPYTDEWLKKMAQDGVKRLNVVCPGFSIDCLESLEEIALRGAETFKEHGGESLDYIPALNDRRDHARFIVQLTADPA